MAGDAPVGRARDKRQLAVGAEIEALEEHITEAVVARQVIHALLAEHQQTVEPIFGQLLDRLCPTLRQLGFGEMQVRRRAHRAATMAGVGSAKAGMTSLMKSSRERFCSLNPKPNVAQ